MWVLAYNSFAPLFHFLRISLSHSSSHCHLQRCFSDLLYQNFRINNYEVEETERVIHLERCMLYFSLSCRTRLGFNITVGIAECVINGTSLHAKDFRLEIMMAFQYAPLNLPHLILNPPGDINIQSSIKNLIVIFASGYKVVQVKYLQKFVLILSQ